MVYTEQRRKMRAVLSGTRCVSPATVYDALSARIAESVGFELGILSGSVNAATLLGAPDLALHTLTEFTDQVTRITRASQLSLLVDADHGYGNALNVMRTVQELEHAGVAALAIEDVAQPARFGNVGQPEGTLTLISLEEMAGKLRAAVAARQDPSLVIVGRLAALRVEDTARAAARAKAYAATGVDALFITGLKKLADLDAIRAAMNLPIILGNTPGLKREDLAARGARILLLGHQPVAAAAKALHDTYQHLYSGGAPAELASKIASPEEMDRYLDAATYRKWRREFLAP